MKEAFKEVPSIWTIGWTDILNTGTWRSAIPIYQKRLAPCHCACPVDGEIPTWVMFARKQLYQEEWSALAANNPFPAVTGRICHHPCEGVPTFKKPPLILGHEISGTVAEVVSNVTRD